MQCIKGKGRPTKEPRRARQGREGDAEAAALRSREKGGISAGEGSRGFMPGCGPTELKNCSLLGGAEGRVL